MADEWDFVRHGTIAHGEVIVASDPPAGFLDPIIHADRGYFTVTFDEPNYVYVDDITVVTAVDPAPVVIGTRRGDNGSPETVEILLDRPLPLSDPIQFQFHDNGVTNYLEYNTIPPFIGLIPTVSRRGLGIFTLLLVTTATPILRRGQPVSKSV